MEESPKKAGKRKAPAEAEMTEDEKEKLRAEGWRFSSDKDKSAMPPPPPPIKKDEDLMALVVQSGGLVAPRLLDALEVNVSGALEAIAALAERDHGRKILHEQAAADKVVDAVRRASIVTEGINVDATITTLTHGCVALANLAMGDGAAAVVEAGGVVAATRAMEWSRPSILAKGCLALGNMAFISAGEEEIANYFSCRCVIASALQAAFEDKEVAQEACDCLVNLVGGEAGKAALSQESPAIWRVGDGMSAPGSHARPGLKGLRAVLRKLLDRWVGCESVKECLQAVEAAMQWAPEPGAAGSSMLLDPAEVMLASDSFFATD